MYITRFTVKGSGAFPFDMLRYDTCVPESEGDSYLLANEVRHGERSVDLKQYHADKRHRVTPGRWQSFGWTLVTISDTRKV